MSLAEDSEADASGAEPPESLQGGKQNPKGLLRAEPSQRRTISPLMLFKEDFGHFKEDLNNFKVDFLSMFKDRDAGTTQEDVSPLTLLKDDFNQFKEDFSNVFTMALSKDRGVAARDRSPHAVPKAQGGRGSTRAEDQNHLLVRAQDLQGTASEAPPESQATRDRKAHNHQKGGQTRPEDGEKDPAASQETSEHPHTDQEVLQPSDADLLHMAAEDSGECEDSEDQWSDTLPPLSEEDQEEEEEEEEFQLLPPEPLTTEICLLSLRPSMRAELEDDPWSVKNYACYLTLDPNTANCELRLSDGNRTATRVWPCAGPAHHHPERFQQCPQVLCREGLLDSAYWEAEWSGGGVDVGVAYNSIGRAGEAAACLLGHNARSWGLECSRGGYAASHRGRRWGSPPAAVGRRVGVFLDWEAGTLSFYGVTPDAMVHLHTFSASFSEPLYPAFWLWAAQASVSLRQVETDWERRLLQ